MVWGSVPTPHWSIAHPAQAATLEVANEELLERLDETQDMGVELVSQVNQLVGAAARRRSATPARA